MPNSVFIRLRSIQNAGDHRKGRDGQDGSDEQGQQRDVALRLVPPAARPKQDRSHPQHKRQQDAEIAGPEEGSPRLRRRLGCSSRPAKKTKSSSASSVTASRACVAQPKSRGHSREKVWGHHSKYAGAEQDAAQKLYDLRR